jgi:hypothetical protein
VNYLLGKSVPFSKIFPSSRSLNLLKMDLESPGKVLEFHLHQSVDTLRILSGGGEGGGGMPLISALAIGPWRRHFDDKLRLCQNHRKNQEVGLVSIL